MRSIRKGDMVEVISGNERGKRGRVLRVIPDKDRLVVQGLNLRWKHMRKTQKAPQGGRLHREAPMHVSKVMLFDETAGARTRVGFRGEGKDKTRISRRTGREIGTPGAAPAKKEAAPKGAKKE